MTSQQLPTNTYGKDQKLEQESKINSYSYNMPENLPTNWHGTWDYLSSRSYGKHIKEMIKFCLNRDILYKINIEEFINGDHDSFYAAISDISVSELYIYIKINDSKNIYNSDEIDRHWKMLLVYFSIKNTDKFQILIDLINTIGFTNINRMDPYNYLITNL